MPARTSHQCAWVIVGARTGSFCDDCAALAIHGRACIHCPGTDDAMIRSRVHCGLVRPRSTNSSPRCRLRQGHLRWRQAPSSARVARCPSASRPPSLSLAHDRRFATSPAVPRAVGLAWDLETTGYQPCDIVQIAVTCADWDDEPHSSFVPTPVCVYCCLSVCLRARCA